MCWHLLVVFFAASAHAFAPAPIWWGDTKLGMRFVLAPMAQSRSVSDPSIAAAPFQRLMTRRQEDLSPHEILHFTANSDQTITLDGTGLCVEAHGDAVSLSRCTRRGDQLWNFVPNGGGQRYLIQLQNQNRCLHVQHVGSRSAPVELTECAQKKQDYWRFEQLISPPTSSPLQRLGLSSPMRHRVASLIVLLTLGVLGLGSSLWRFRWRQKKARAATMSTGHFPFDQGGLCLKIPVAASRSSVPSTPLFFDTHVETTLPVVMAAGPADVDDDDPIKLNEQITDQITDTRDARKILKLVETYKSRMNGVNLSTALYRITILCRELVRSDRDDLLSSEEFELLVGLILVRGVSGPQSVADMAVTFAHLQYFPQRLLLPFLKRIAAQLEQKSFEPQHLARVTWSLGKLRIEPERLLESLELQAIENLDALDTQSCSNMLWGFAQLNWKSRQFLPKVSTMMLSRDMLFDALPDDLTDIAFSLVYLSEPAERSDLLLGLVPRLQIEHGLREFSSRQLVTIVWAFSRLNAAASLPDGLLENLVSAVREKHEQRPMRPIDARVLETEIKNLNGLLKRDMDYSWITQTRYAGWNYNHLAIRVDKQGYIDEREEVASNLGEYRDIYFKFRDARHPRTVLKLVEMYQSRMNGVNLATALYMLARLCRQQNIRERDAILRTYQFRQLIRLIAAHTVFGTKAITRMMWAFARLQHLPKPMLIPLLKLITAELERKTFSPQEVAIVTWALGKLRIKPDRVLESIELEAIHNLYSLNIVNCCHLLWGFAKLQWKPQKILPNISTMILSRDLLVDAQPTHLRDIAFSLVYLSEPGECDDLLLGLVPGLQFEDGLREFTTRQLVTIVWAFSRLKVAACLPGGLLENLVREVRRQHEQERPLRGIDARVLEAELKKLGIDHTWIMARYMKEPQNHRRLMVDVDLITEGNPGL